MATLIHLGTRGVNLDAVRYWQDSIMKSGRPRLTLFFSEDDVEHYQDTERAQLLRALDEHSMHYTGERSDG